MIEHIDFIEALRDQIAALLDLMQAAGDRADGDSIVTAADMCQTMLYELMTEVEKIETEYKAGLESKVNE